VLATYLAIWTTGWTGGPLPEPPWWLVAETGLALGALAWVLRLPSVAVGAAALGAVVVARHSHALGPFGWGVLLLALGFASLAAGVVFNWRRRARPAP
jgi:hypothetical protein